MASHGPRSALGRRLGAWRKTMIINPDGPWGRKAPVTEAQPDADAAKRARAAREIREGILSGDPGRIDLAKRCCHQIVDLLGNALANMLEEQVKVTCVEMYSNDSRDVLVSASMVTESGRTLQLIHSVIIGRAKIYNVDDDGDRNEVGEIEVRTTPPSGRPGNPRF